MPQTTAPPVVAIDAASRPAAIPFSICTLVSDLGQHAAMAESFVAHGFGPEMAEFLILDNSGGNRWDAFQGIARLLAAARGRYAILCHQDVRLIGDGAAALLARLAELDRSAPDWALAGNAGGQADGALAIRISDPHGEDQRRGRLPARVESLDENFIVLRRDWPVGLSADIGGFHLYGADLCLQARLAGRSAWVVDFHLRHLSGGTAGADFLRAQARFEAKYTPLLRPGQRIRTTCTWLRVPGSGLGRWWARRALARRLARAGG